MKHDIMNIFSLISVSLMMRNHLYRWSYFLVSAKTHKMLFGTFSKYDHQY